MVSATMTLRFAYATLADVPAVAALVELAYRGPQAAAGWTNEAGILAGPRSSVSEVEALVRDGNSRFVTAFEANRLVGSALIQQYAAGAYFGMFAIDPDRQAAGIGKAIIARCEDAARELWGAAYMKLTVISLREPLIAWYERRGYVRTGAREPFPFHLATGALRTDFDLVVLQKPL
jgi:GNAT superfamily N-acetyltransferase